MLRHVQMAKTSPTVAVVGAGESLPGRLCPATKEHKADTL